MMPSKRFNTYHASCTLQHAKYGKIVNLVGRHGITRHCSVCNHEPGMHKCCPQCPATASGEEAIEEQFGFRTIDDKCGRYQIPQTWCRDCRRRSLKK